MVQKLGQLRIGCTRTFCLVEGLEKLRIGGFGTFRLVQELGQLRKEQVRIRTGVGPFAVRLVGSIGGSVQKSVVVRGKDIGREQGHKGIWGTGRGAAFKGLGQGGAWVNPSSAGRQRPIGECRMDRCQPGLPLPCLCSKVVKRTYHPAVIICNSLDVVLPQLLAPLHLHDQESFRAGAGAVEGSDRNEEGCSWLSLESLIAALQNPLTVHHHPVLAAVMMPLQADAAAGGNP